jgi:hypothetical protein
MVAQVVEASALTGKTAELVIISNRTVVATSSASEDDSDPKLKGKYRATFTDLPQAAYQLVVWEPANNRILAEWWVRIEAGTGPFYAMEVPPAVDSGNLITGFTSEGSEQLAAIITQNRPRLQVAYTTDILITSFDRLAQDFTALGSLNTRTNLVFMVKDSLSDADADALLWVDEDTGLIRVNGAAAGSSALGSLTVNDATAGNISVVVDATVTGVIAPTSANGYFYAIKLMKTGGVGSRQLRTGRVVVVNGVVRTNE